MSDLIPTRDPDPLGTYLTVIAWVTCWAGLAGVCARVAFSIAGVAP